MARREGRSTDFTFLGKGTGRGIGVSRKIGRNSLRFKYERKQYNGYKKPTRRISALVGFCYGGKTRVLLFIYACSSKALLSRPQMGQTKSSGGSCAFFIHPKALKNSHFFGTINLIYLNLTTIFGKEKKGRRNEALSYESNFAAWKYIDT